MKLHSRANHSIWYESWSDETQTDIVKGESFAGGKSRWLDNQKNKSYIVSVATEQFVENAWNSESSSQV
jgi:hypothetical protein